MKAFGGSQPMPKMPEPVRIPTANDPDVIAGMRERMQNEFSKRKGRSSTDLSGSAGQPYSRTTLG